MDNNASVIVIGAGIVGAAIARALQRDGHAVTLVDSAEPGRAASYGNAGLIKSFTPSREVNRSQSISIDAGERQ